MLSRIIKIMCLSEAKSWQFLYRISDTLSMDFLVGEHPTLCAWFKRALLFAFLGSESKGRPVRT